MTLKRRRVNGRSLDPAGGKRYKKNSDKTEYRAHIIAKEGALVGLRGSPVPSPCAGAPRAPLRAPGPIIRGQGTF